MVVYLKGHAEKCHCFSILILVIFQHFPDIDISRHGMNPMAAYGQPPRGIQRTMSAQMGVGPFVGGGSVNGGVSRQQSLLMQQTQQQHQPQAPARPVGLWDSQSSLAQVIGFKIKFEKNYNFFVLISGWKWC